MPPVCKWKIYEDKITKESGNCLKESRSYQGKASWGKNIHPGLWFGKMKVSIKSRSQGHPPGFAGLVQIP
ncbi:MAG TPA: hypothetical protein DCE41_10750 [Cytophagales bacterium]|nr:hypothetical protein [Cytophagales bacterium]HAA24450.1 hypothetical protein [Cytophagales bacterium]HAP61230.1 hypothetical protein [Cytophagales bacterium]